MNVLSIQAKVRDHALRVCTTVQATERVRKCSIIDRHNWQSGRAGEACLSSSSVSIHMNMLLCDTEVVYMSTLYHEFAHVIAGLGVGHGEAWKSTMRKLGLTPDRCHSIAVHTKIPGKYQLTHCSCREYSMSNRAVNSILRGDGRFCRECRVNVKIGPLPKQAVAA